MEARLELKLAQKLIMTPQLQQAIKLLQLSRLELTQTLAQELVENPVLEEVPSDTAEDSPEGELGPDDLSAAGTSAETTRDSGADTEGERELKGEFDQVGAKWDDYISDM